MMPLTLANPGEENIIRKIGGKPEVKKHLENLGFVAGGNVTVISATGGNVQPVCGKLARRYGGEERGQAETA